MCEGLSIECRGSSRGGGKMFLIMSNSRVVAQIAISDEFFLEKANPIGKFMDCERIRRYLIKKANKSRSCAVSDLNVGMNRINLSAKVLELQETKSVYTRFGNNMIVTHALIGDNSGTVKLSLWGAQIASISVGDTVQITNARLRAFKGEKQLQLGRKGILQVEHDPNQSTIKNDLSISG